jgi:hypothetical protein
MRVLGIGSTIKKALFGVFRAIRTDDEGRLETVVPAGTTADVNLQEVNGTTVVEGGVSGLLAIAGNVANAITDVGNPVKVGARALAILTSVLNNQRSDLITDLNQRLWTRPASYNELVDAIRASVNTIAQDYSSGFDIWIDSTNVGATTYYPDVNGWEVGTHTFLTLVFTIEDGTMEFEIYNGSNWVDATAMMVWTANGSNGWSGTNFTEPGTGTPLDFAVSWDRLRFYKLRAKFTRSDPANTVKIYAMYGAN